MDPFLFPVNFVPLYICVHSSKEKIHAVSACIVGFTPCEGGHWTHATKPHVPPLQPGISFFSGNPLPRFSDSI